MTQSERFRINKFKYPNLDSCLSVLNKLEFDKSQLHLDCQDWEYTIADKTRYAEYIGLYRCFDITDQEKRVLRCFIIQSLTDLLPTGITVEEARKSLAMLVRDKTIK